MTQHTADNDNPVFGFAKEIGISASGTLANGLEVAFSDTLDLTDVDAEEGSFELELGGAFGTLTMGSVDSAVDSTSVGMPGELDYDVSTDGSAGFGLSYALPTMGALDVAISYFPNADDAGLDDSEYMDTFGIGAAFDAGMATVSFGLKVHQVTTLIVQYQQQLFTLSQQQQLLSQQYTVTLYAVIWTQSQSVLKCQYQT